VSDTKYLSIDELETLCDILKKDIARFKAHIRNPDWTPAGSDYYQRNLKETEKLLDEAEAEILERTLLQCDNPDGVSN
jgi:hypothetical protein